MAHLTDIEIAQAKNIKHIKNIASKLKINEDDLEIMNRLLSKLDNPYIEQKGIDDYQSPSSDESYQTFCGT